MTILHITLTHSHNKPRIGDMLSDMYCVGANATVSCHILVANIFVLRILECVLFFVRPTNSGLVTTMIRVPLWSFLDL